VLRCIFGAKQENGAWQKSYNYELYEIFNEPNIVNYIKAKRLAWSGHLVRVNSDRTLRKYSTQNQMEQEDLEDRNCDGRMVLIKM
jgi:hypothetical protein